MGNELLISNVTMDGLVKLSKKLSSVQINNGFGTWEQYLIDPDHYKLNSYSCIFIILDGNALMESGKDVGYVSHVLSVLEDFLYKHREINVYISNVKCSHNTTIRMEDMRKIESFEWEINNEIYGLCENYENVVCINIKRIIENIGEDKAYSKQMEYMSSCPYSIGTLKMIADELSAVDYFRTHPRKKCLVLDLDNTLWGGVVGEDGIEGITISNHKEGKKYYDFQRIILKIKGAGAILAISSKNNEEDVKELFDKGDMPLKKDDFVSFRINWGPKSQAITEIASELNIGLDSIVFVDDNPAEREEVKTHLTEVEVPDFPANSDNLEKYGLFLYERYFKIDKLLKEDVEKTDMYIANRERNKLKSTIHNIDDFIKSLEMVLTVFRGDVAYVGRIAQMTQKTNQFNLTTKRYTELEIGQFLEDKGKRIYIGSVKDRFGDNGITLLCILTLNEISANIDEFLMSCRVMERRLEYDFLHFIENDLEKEGFTVLNGEFIRTKKNAPASNFLREYGFDEDTLPSHYSKIIRKQEFTELMKIKG